MIVLVVCSSGESVNISNLSTDKSSSIVKSSRTHKSLKSPVPEIIQSRLLVDSPSPTASPSLEPLLVQEGALCSLLSSLHPYSIGLSCNHSAPTGSKLSTDPCQLSTYFSCNSDGLITRMSSLWIQGRLPPSIGDLSLLEELRLPGSDINGTIPSSFGNLKRLWYLDLSHNFLTGPLPDSFSGLTNMERIYLNRNGLTGPIPSWIGNFNGLHFLDFSDNHFSGNIPNSITGLTSLYYFVANNNSNVVGKIPTSIGNMSNLQLLDLRSNRLTGPIPPSIVACQHLFGLLLTDNFLTGSIPNVIAYEVNLDNNRLSGVLPDKFCCQGPGLIGRIYSAQRNRITGSVPVCACTSVLIKLSLSSNLLTGTMVNVKPHKRLETLLLANNSLSGSLPGFLDWNWLQTVNLSSNRLTGQIPQSWGLLHTLSIVDLSNNQFQGEISSALCNLTLLSSFYAKGNAFQCYPSCLSASRGDFLSTYEHCQSQQDDVLCELATSYSLASKMRYLLISSQKTYHRSSTEAIPRYSYYIAHTVSVTKAVYYSISFDPVSFNYLKNYRMFFYDYDYKLLAEVRMFTYSNTPSDLPGVGSTPPIIITAPSFFVQINQIVYDNTVSEYYFTVTAQSTGTGWACTTRTTYSTSGVAITRPYAADFCSWTGVSCAKETSVTSLSLHGYGLQGAIPSSIGLLTALITLDFSFNKLNGTLPTSLGKLLSLQTLDLSSNLLHGIIDESIVALPELVFFSVSNNFFVGPVPIFSSTSLVSLNLDSNDFHGTIWADLCVTMEVYCRGLVTMTGNPKLTCFETCWTPFASQKIFDPWVKVCAPSSQPSSLPSMPSSQPSNMPSCMPSKPSNQPTQQPSTVPSIQPISRPTRQPSSVPTIQPRIRPSKQPLVHPTYQPSLQPSSRPSLPSSRPSCSPSRRPLQSPPQITLPPMIAAAIPSSTTVTPLIGSMIGVGILVFFILLFIALSPMIIAYNRSAYYKGLPVHMAIIDKRKVMDIKEEHMQSAYIMDADGKTAIDLLLERRAKVIGVSGPTYEFLYRLVSGDLPEVGQQQMDSMEAADIEAGKPLRRSSYFRFFGSRKKVYSDIVDDGLERCPSRKNIDRCMQGHSWTVIIQREEDFAVEIVRRILSENKDKSSILANSLDKFGRRQLDIASSKCKLVLNSFRYLHGRYDLKPGPPEHKSKTSLIRFATDRNSSDEVPVALKFMSHREQYLNEILSRARGSFSNEFVISVLRSYDGDSENEEEVLFRKDAIFKGYYDYPYCVVIDVADHNLKKVIDQQNICAKEWDDIRSIVKQLAVALDHIHSKGFIHGDIKPTNIVLTGQKLRLIDFDASAAIDADRYAGAKYSSAYIPPELLFRSEKERGKVLVRTFEKAADEVTPSYNYISLLEYSLLPAAPSFDMWAFGAVMYLLCTGS